MRFMTHSLLILLILWTCIAEGRTVAKAAGNSVFNDSDEAKWAISSIASMRYAQFIDGYDDGSFRPNQAVTRIEAIVMAVRLMGLDEEAKTKLVSDPLPYSYDTELNEGYSWAKGYVSVAVEQEVLLPTEYFLDPQLPASRAWATVLMMRALDLGFLAYERRGSVPEFTDGQDFPEISYGYVSVALEYDVISGYSDGTFQPNRAVTRTEMATLLEHTNRLKWQRKGAFIPAGVIQSIAFDENGNGTITIVLHESTVFSYTITSELPISLGDKMIKASELRENDNVILLVMKKNVIEGSVVEQSQFDPLTSSILGFKININLYNGDHVKGFYAYEHGIAFASSA